MHILIYFFRLACVGEEGERERKRAMNYYLVFTMFRAAFESAVPQGGMATSLFSAVFSQRAAASPSEVKAKAAAAAVTALILNGAIKVHVSGEPVHRVIVAQLLLKQTQGAGGQQLLSSESDSKLTAPRSLEAGSGDVRLRGRDSVSASATVSQAALAQRDAEINELRKMNAAMEATVKKLAEAHEEGMKELRKGISNQSADKKKFIR